MDEINLAQVIGEWRTRVKAAVNLGGSVKLSEFCDHLSSCKLLKQVPIQWSWLWSDFTRLIHLLMG
jgi:hypothetical protein